MTGMRFTALTLAVLLAVGGTAFADKGKGATAATPTGKTPATATSPATTAAKSAPARKVVIAPLGALTDGIKGLDALRATLEKGAAGVPGVTVIAGADVDAAVKKAKRSELKSCDADAHCLAELGKLVGADEIVAGEVSELDGDVAYLKAVNVADEKEVGSTTAVLPTDAAGRDAEARAAAFRLLAPDAYVGTLALHIDVAGAKVYLDGQRVPHPSKPIPVAVGTHALRVTHGEYRDFVRFVDVKFDETTDLPVNLKAYPIVSDEMRQKDSPIVPPKPTYVDGAPAPRPWYRKWWAVAGAGAILAVTAAVIVSSSPGLSFDRSVVVDGK